MRQKQKLVERMVLGVFARALESRGIPPLHVPEITDAPDAMFVVEGQGVAVECRYLSHPKLLRLLGPNDWPPDKVYEVFLPVEPHLWVRDAIVEKNRKIPSYKARTGATQAWLLLHSSARQKILRADRSLDSEFFELLCLGARLADHNFDQIWLVEVDAENQVAIPIYGPGVEVPTFTFEAYLARFPEYPVDHFWFANAMVKLEDRGNKIASVNLNDLVVEPVCLQPLDKRYSINYQAILNDKDRNANLKGLNFAFYEAPPNF